MRWARSIAIGLVVFTFVPRPPGTAMARAPQIDKTKAYDDAFEKAEALVHRGEFFEALKGFQKANQLAGGRSAGCFAGMAQAMVGMKT